MREKQTYFSYLLRLWRASERDKAVWRASLEDPMDGKRQGFASLSELCAFLQAQTRGRAPDDERDDLPAKL